MRNRFQSFLLKLSTYNWRNFVLTSALISLIAIGIHLHKDYGVPSDEPVERMNGIVSLNYVADFFGVKSLQASESLAVYRHLSLDTYFDRDYPVLFNLPAALLERVFHINDEQKIYFFRHLLNYLVCLLGIYAVFRLAERRFADWRYGMLAATMFVLSPRFFAEFFYNTKDLIFLTFFVIAINSLISFILKPSFKSAFLHAVAVGFAVDARIMGVIFIPLTIFAFLMRHYFGVEKKSGIKYLVVFIAFCFLCIFLFWPWLWADPFGRFVEAFQKMAQFSRGSDRVLYFGEIVSTKALPWHYIPSWILISTPLLYVIFFIIGVGSTFLNFFKKYLNIWSDDHDVQDFIFIALFFAPLFAVIFMKSILYDGWRQMYFLYPSFLILAVGGYRVIWRFAASLRYLQAAHFAIIILTVFYFSYYAFYIHSVHPYQNVYFNFLAGKNLKERFDLDYWGLSNRQALEYILSSDNRTTVRVWSNNFPKLDVAMKSLPFEDRNRLKVVDQLADADYVVNNYRLDPLDYSHNGVFTRIKDIYSDNEIIVTVFQRDIPNLLK
jgi:hypothetical protein